MNKDQEFSFWDNRYKEDSYAYGILPNEFLKDSLQKIPTGKILLPAEGEGRNALFAAHLGFDVDAFDNSKWARKKAMKLFEENDVKVNYWLSSYEDIQLKNSEYQAIGSIYAHCSPELRRKMHRSYSNALQKGGYLILEGFSTDQLSFNSGGPKNMDMLYSEELVNEFQGLKTISIERKIIELNEGLYHIGKASVIQLIMQKIS